MAMVNLAVMPQLGGGMKPVSKGQRSTQEQSSPFLQLLQQVSQVDQGNQHNVEHRQSNLENEENDLITEEKLKELFYLLGNALAESGSTDPESPLAKLLLSAQEQGDWSTLLDALLEELGLEQVDQLLKEEKEYPLLLHAFAVLAASSEHTPLADQLQRLLAVLQESNDSKQPIDGFESGEKLQLVNARMLSALLHVTGKRSQSAAPTDDLLSNQMFLKNGTDAGPFLTPHHHAGVNHWREGPSTGQTIPGVLPYNQGLPGEGVTNSETVWASALNKAAHPHAVSDESPWIQGPASMTVSSSEAEGKTSSLVVRYHHLVQDLQNILRMNISHNKPGVLQQIKVKIHPQHLGEIDIQLTSQEGKWTIQLLTSSRLALEALDRHLYQLQAMLYQQGVQVERIEVAQEPTSSHMLHTGQNDAEHHTGGQNGKNRSSHSRGSTQDHLDQEERYTLYKQDEQVTVDYTV